MILWGGLGDYNIWIYGGLRLISRDPLRPVEMSDIQYIVQQGYEVLLQSPLIPSNKQSGHAAQGLGFRVSRIVGLGCWVFIYPEILSFPELGDPNIDPETV